MPQSSLPPARGPPASPCLLHRIPVRKKRHNSIQVPGVSGQSVAHIVSFCAVIAVIYFDSGRSRNKRMICYNFKTVSTS